MREEEHYMMNDNTIVHLVKHLDVTDLAGEKVMIDFATGKYFLLKGSASIHSFLQQMDQNGFIEFHN